MRSHWRWIGRATLAFAAPALLALALLDGWAALVLLPVAFLPVAQFVPILSASDLLPTILAGIPFGAAVVGLRILHLRRRGRPLPLTMIAPTPLAARAPRELLPAAVTALVAGVTEELAFRLAIPLLIARLTGNSWLGFAVATAAFAALHRYQPWWGQVGVVLTALVFIALYLSTGALWLVMLLHGLIDVMALAVRPWLAGFGAAPSSSAASPFGRSR